MNFKVKLKLERIDKLHLHEEVIPEMLSKLVNDFKREGIQRDPIIVDENNLVVLDGMHRVEALRSLGCKLIAVCLVNYNDPRILVNTWWRTLHGNKSLIYQVVRQLNFNFKVKPRNHGLNIRSIKLPAIILQNEILEFEFNDIYNSHHKMKLLENHFKNVGFKINYEIESDALDKLSSNLCDAVIGLPMISKTNVIEIALTGKVFPHKSTRHVIPFRPLAINVPLSILKSEDLRKANEMFIKLLVNKKGKFLPPQVFRGRKYEEHIYVFEDVQ